MENEEFVLTAEVTEFVPVFESDPAQADAGAQAQDDFVYEAPQASAEAVGVLDEAPNAPAEDAWKDTMMVPVAGYDADGQPSGGLVESVREHEVRIGYEYGIEFYKLDEEHWEQVLVWAQEQDVHG